MSRLIVTTLLLIVAIWSSEQARPEPRISGGELASNFQFPWHASLHVTRFNLPMVYCGGSLISEDSVLTTARCLTDALVVTVTLGSISFSRPAITLNSREWMIHPLYIAETFSNNIALVKLPQRIMFNNNHRAIRLPAISQIFEPFANVEALVSGFGVTSTESNVLSEQLRFARKLVISNEQCMQIFNPIYIQQNTMCAIGVNFTIQSACFGDAGGALVIQELGTWTQIGVVNFISGAGCESGDPVGFTRTAINMQWIAENGGVMLRP